MSNLHEHFQSILKTSCPTSHGEERPPMHLVSAGADFNNDIVMALNNAMKPKVRYESKSEQAKTWEMLEKMVIKTYECQKL